MKGKLRDTSYALITSQTLAEFISIKDDFLDFKKKYGQNILHHLRRYRFACERLTRKKVLNLGVGSGYGLEMLSRKDNSVVGFDISQDSLKKAEEFFPGHDLRLGNCERMKFFSGYFEAVVAFEVYEHCWYPEKAISESYRVLKKGGCLIGSMPLNRPHFFDQEAPSQVKSTLSFVDVKRLVTQSFQHPEWFFQESDGLGGMLPLTLSQAEKLNCNPSMNTVIFVCKK